MKGIKLCIECANYNIEKHSCSIGCNKETDASDPFYDDCPLPDVTEVSVGEWIFDDADECGYSYKCSECHSIIIFRSKNQLTNFCPNCGADMRGNKND